MDHEKEAEKFVERLQGMVYKQIPQIAAASGLTPSTIRKYLNGTEPGIFKVIAMEEAAKKPRGWLLGVGTEMTIPHYGSFSALSEGDADGNTIINQFPHKATCALTISTHAMAGVIDPGFTAFLQPRSDNTISDEELLCARLNGVIQVGFLSRLPDGSYICRFSNPSYDTVKLDKDAKIDLVYKVLGIAKNF